ncbi:MAG: cytochrome c [bacterium]|nr:cytochrome c [bacterium]
MKELRLVAATIATALAFAIPGNLFAADKFDLGKREYMADCASCHGVTGKGDGAYVELLKNRPTDITTLSRINNGVFPFARVYEYVDGTREIKAHGSRDMPIWGQRYRIDAANYYGDMDYDDESFVRSRILALTEYIYRLQAK